MLWIIGMAQKATNIAANWASEQELQLSIKKTEIVLFTHKRNPNLGSLLMNGSKLELSKEARLLGVTLDCKLTWKPHINRSTRKQGCRNVRRARGRAAFSKGTFNTVRTVIITNIAL